VKLNLGCWDRPIPGFINVDSQNLPGLDLVMDIKNLENFKSNSADLIYASHVIAYFDRATTVDVFSEWKRVLKPGGILRVSTPDLTSLIKIYKETENLDKIIGPLYGKMNGGSDLIYHKQVFDRFSLVKMFTEGGFCEISDWDWRTTEHSAIDDHSQAYYPHMQKKTGLQVSLNLEAKKPHAN
jgi:predicted SAM-dependent methyltransferase